MCTADTPLDEASRRMEDSGCGTLAVVDSRARISGILTDRDIALAIGTTSDHPTQIPVTKVMTQPVYTCTADETIAAAVERMADARVRRLPVVDDEGQVQGLVSIDDIVLWAVPSGGVKPKAVLKALRRICAAHHPMFDTEAIAEPATVTRSAEDDIC
jgi:signal-transduction protein with cAMP-binding, CBS, and nucleotidyltransferase domain